MYPERERLQQEAMQRVNQLPGSAARKVHTSHDHSLPPQWVTPAGNKQHIKKYRLGSHPKEQIIFPKTLEAIGGLSCHHSKEFITGSIDYTIAQVCRLYHCALTWLPPTPQL